ncbi:MAG: hypothetical protein ABR608_08110 [Pseudonocardiaceae bacterium]
MSIALLAVGAAVATAAGYWWLAAGAPNLGGLALAGSEKELRELVTQPDDAYLRALRIGFLLILGYGLALAAGNTLAWWLSFTVTARQISHAALVATGVVVLSAIGENLMLLQMFDGADGDGFAVAAQAFAFTKWSVGIPVAVVASLGVGATMWRAIRPGPPRPPTVIHPAVDPDPGLICDADGGPGTQRAVWRANSSLPDSGLPEYVAPLQGAAGIGVCVSGGGIRAAAITFGALDALRDVLTHARWLVAVGGGGYAAGALQLALQQLPRGVPVDGWRSVARARDVYHPGSPELDHTRRHGRYLADGTCEWLALGGTVLRGFLVNVLTVGLLVVLLARLLAHLYAFVAPDPLIWTSWMPEPGVLWAVGVLVVTWLLLSTVSVLVEPVWRPVTRLLHEAGSAALIIAVVVALAGLGLPLLACASRAPPAGSVVLGSPAVSLVGGYLAALLAVGRRPWVRDAMGQGRAWWRSVSVGGRKVLATVGVYAGLLALVSGFVVLFGAVFAHTGPISGTAGWPWRVSEWGLTVGLVGMLWVLAAVDQVRWSLHPFYRRRLASAFAVRRLHRGGQVRAEPYDFDAETTSLHTHAKRSDGFPEVIFCCAAHVSGQQVAPPGRRVVPWTLSGNYVGGPAHGWVATGELHGYLSSTVQHDLTVQTAQAISGAIFASHMGVQQRVYAKFLTLSNIRLGSWLPNPAYLHQTATAADQSWALPRLPRRRHLTTLLQELLGVYPANGPLVYVTGGGHYENLGLVEVLRRWPAIVYCVDASGDQRDVSRTLAQAIELAYEELGVTLTFDDAARLGAGPDQPHPVEPQDQLMAKLIDRIAATCVITGTISYPDLGDRLPPAQGKIVVGRAALTPETPFPLLAYGRDHPEFPTDGTSDQWFEARQFDAYHSLGRHVGTVMGERMPLPDVEGTAFTPPARRRRSHVL